MAKAGKRSSPAASSDDDAVNPKTTATEGETP